MRSESASVIGIILASTVFGHAALAQSDKTGWVRTYVMAHGGCGPHRSLFQGLIVTGPGSVRNLLGRPAEGWTRSDAAEALNVYRECDERFIARGRTVGGRDEMMANAYAQSAGRQMASLEAALNTFVAFGRDKADEASARDAARTRQADEDVDIRLQQAQEASKRKQDRLREQAARDRDEAARSARLSEAEAPQIDALTREVEEASRAREAAEQRLKEVRQKIELAERQRLGEIARTQQADTDKQREIAREKYREEGDRLAPPCKITQDQFSKASFGMSLREVERLMGCAGKQISSTRIGNLGVLAIYAWDGTNAPSAATLTFKDEVLESKAQLGLN